MSRAKKNNIYFVGFAKHPDELIYKKHLEQLCKTVDIFILPGGNKKLYLLFSLIANLFSNKPFTVKKYFRKEAANRISKILENNNINLAHFDMLHLGIYLSFVHSVPKILVNHNVESIRLARLIEVQKNILIRLYLYLQYKKLVNFEKKICPKFVLWFL